MKPDPSIEERQRLAKVVEDRAEAQADEAFNWRESSVSLQARGEDASAGFDQAADLDRESADLRTIATILRAAPERPNNSTEGGEATEPHARGNRTANAAVAPGESAIESAGSPERPRDEPFDIEKLPEDFTRRWLDAVSTAKHDSRAPGGAENPYKNMVSAEAMIYWWETSIRPTLHLVSQPPGSSKEPEYLVCIACGRAGVHADDCARSDQPLPRKTQPLGSGLEEELHRIIREEMGFLQNWMMPRQRVPDNCREARDRMADSATSRVLAALRADRGAEK